MSEVPLKWEGRCSGPVVCVLAITCPSDPFTSQGAAGGPEELLGMARRAAAGGAPPKGS